MPGIFLHDSDAHRVYDSLQLVRGIMTWMTRDDLQAIRRQGNREAVIAATGGHFTIISITTGRHSLQTNDQDRSRIFSVFTPLPELVEELNHFQPTVMFGYPDLFLLLAQEQAAGRLRIAPVAISVGGETFEPATREQITTAFNCPVRDIYGASEFPAIAFGCAHGWLHVNADWVILEPVDEAYQPVAPGQMSYTVLLTNLANRIQPIIRYDLGDRITVRPDPCPCGSSLPAIQVEGRHDEILSFPTPTGETIQVLPLILDCAVQDTPGVRRFQLIQTAPTTLRLRLEFEPGADERQVSDMAVRRLRDTLSTQGVPSAEIHRASEPPRRDPASGKFRQIWAEKGVAQAKVQKFILRDREIEAGKANEE